MGFIRDLDIVMNSTQQVVAKVNEILVAKQADLKGSSQGPLVEAKTELTKMSSRAAAAKTKLDQLKRQIAEEKDNQVKREMFEKDRKNEQKEKKVKEAAFSPKSDVYAVKGKKRKEQREEESAKRRKVFGSKSEKDDK